MIELKNIQKTYFNGESHIFALNSTNIRIDEKEYISIMGQSGSGKSTLLSIIGCLDKPSCGEYFFNGINISSTKDEYLYSIRNKKIGFVFQSFNLLPKMNALENVELPMIYYGKSEKERKKRAIELLEYVGLKERMYHKPNEMSGGQKQRVAIARALSNSPQLILADEPTGNLDSQSEIEIMNLFDTLNKEGNTIIIVTHEPEISKRTKRTIKLKDGKIVYDSLYRGDRC